jgi:oxygen-independent coproporphyrinogen-3 oxidase
MTQLPASSFQPALYLHIPFCAARCHYCDFNTYAGLEALYEPYISALSREIHRAGEAAGRPSACTIFIGGGTPTVLPVALLAQALDACFAAFDVAPSAEITCEANPGTTDQAHFVALRALGVNRLSLGVQSFDDGELGWLGRIHTAREAESAFVQARLAGFENINLDLIFGLPGIREAGNRGLGENIREFPPSSLRAGRSTARRDEELPAKQSPAPPQGNPDAAQVERWQRTLARAIALGSEHLSLYSLTVERGTPLARQVRRGRVAAPDDDLAADLYEAAGDLLAEHGYVHYEISNWALSNKLSAISHKPSAVGHRPSASSFQLPASPNPQIPASGFHYCQHNLVYWRREPYLGFGAGAHSFDGVRRAWNVRSVPRYIQRVESGRSPQSGGERVGRRQAMSETMMLGLRLVGEGVPDERFRAQFGVDLEDVFGAEISALVARGLLERLPDRVRLTPAGVLLGNRVFAEFMGYDDGP